ncbi:MAG TPA: right-handed parallel beta-helix repeat-containing protein [Gemmatimonadaceae bacterium]
MSCRLRATFGPIALSCAVLIARATDARAQKSTPTIALRRGLVITHSVRVAPRTYHLAADSSLDSAVITIKGDDITVDFAGASLVGLDPNADPDQARGIGIYIEGGRNVRVVNATVRGYKVGLLARGAQNLTLARDDFSHNWKPRLFSVIEHESLADWLSHHHNEQREWLRFGAAAYLEDVHGGEIQGVRIEQGMEGLMLVRSDSLRIWNNVVEFNSGVGIGLYRSSDNVIMHNRASYNVRGYSHGFYRRGQDSADLLLYEQSCRNVVAYNSMTHGGDGLFLWAGQSTMDTGEGGSNDNLFYANDFSFAPTNGMEATFSRNVFAENRVEGSDYGLWGGYSFDSRIVGNHFTRNRTGIAIEHGQNNSIARNVFDGDTVAINLWANPIEPGDWGYPKHRDTRSRDYIVGSNTFTGNRVGVRTANTTGEMVGNRFLRVDSGVVRVDTSAFPDVGGSADIGLPATPAPIAGGVDARALDSLASRDRSAIIVDEWGPYDWRSPKLWPVDSGRGAAIRLRVLGPAGRWRVVGRRGLNAISADHGRVGDTVTVSPSVPHDWTLTLEYRGTAAVSPRGGRTPAGGPYQFSYGRFEPLGGWHLAVFPWTDAEDPRSHPDAFAALLRGTPSLSVEQPRLDLMWFRPAIPGVPAAKWAAVATTTFVLDSGTYTLRTISDDGIRVWLDGRLVIDDWTPHESRVDSAPIGPGRHALRVEYYQVDGWTEFRVEVVRGRQRSSGSPGPH